MRRAWTPSIVPAGFDQTVYLVLDDFGTLGRAWRETEFERADLENTISDLMTGQYNDPLAVIAFNVAEQISNSRMEQRTRAGRRTLAIALQTSADLHHLVHRSLVIDRNGAL
jgi:negative regulator of sigma E activity